jgi:hypothetical protein
MPLVPVLIRERTALIRPVLLPQLLPMSFGPEILPPPSDLLWQKVVDRSASSDIASQRRGQSTSPPTSTRTPLSQRDVSASPSRMVEFKLPASDESTSQGGESSALGETD